MKLRSKLSSILAGGAAGVVNGLFGAGGGMILVPMLSRSEEFTDREVFSSSVIIILPMCLVSLTMSRGGAPLPWQTAWPYLLGSIPGGIFAGIFGKRIPVTWLHRFLGVLILYGGIRYLC